MSIGLVVALLGLTSLALAILLVPLLIGNRRAASRDAAECRRSNSGTSRMASGRQVSPINATARPRLIAVLLPRR